MFAAATDAATAVNQNRKNAPKPPPKKKKRPASLVRYIYALGHTLSATDAEKNALARKLRHRGKRENLSTKLNLHIPIYCIAGALRRLMPAHMRLSKEASIGLAAAFQYIIGEYILNALSYMARFDDRRITPRRLMLSLAEDEELMRCMPGLVLGHAGVVPNIPQQYLSDYMQKKLTKAAASAAGSETAAAFASI